METKALDKLHMHKFDKTLVINAPEEFNAVLPAYKGELHTEKSGNYSHAVAFVKSDDEWAAYSVPMSKCIEGDGELWVCYPKGTSKKYRRAKCNRDTLKDTLVKYGFQAVSLFSLDDDWSAMRFRKSMFVGK